MTPELIEQIRARWQRTTGQATPRFKTVPQGAATTVWAGFVAPADAVGGRYCEDCHVCEVNDDANSRAGVRSYAVNGARAEDLWSKSEEMVDDRFSFWPSVAFLPNARFSTDPIAGGLEVRRPTSLEGNLGLRNNCVTVAFMQIFAALAAPTRTKVIEVLARNDLSAGEIAPRFPVSRPAVSRHLSVSVANS